jgi:heat shock protein 5
MARGNQSSLVLGLSALFYLALLFLPLSFIQTASAEQDPLQESYGTGKILNSFLNSLIMEAEAD